MELSLLDQEKESRRHGSGLRADDLLGLWRLERVWPRRGTSTSGLSSALLRGLGAQLEIRRADPLVAPEGTALQILNSVRLGILRLQFEGPARLQGHRPLLVFRFEHLRIQLGDWSALHRTLPHKEPFEAVAVGALPFFALIGLGASGTTLVARGRGGGLAQWRRTQAVGEAADQQADPKP